MVNKVINKMTNNFEKNLKCIKKEFIDINKFILTKEHKNLLHIFCDDLYDEDKCFFAIQTLLKAGLNPNFADYYNYNFIMTAMESGYSEEFIINIIKESLKYNLNVNHRDMDKDTMMHILIQAEDYEGDFINIYKLLCENGFNSSLKNDYGNSIIDEMIEEDRFSPRTIREMKKFYVEEMNKLPRNKIEIQSKPSELSKKEKEELENYGIILNDKIYLTNPTIGRELELKNLMVTLGQKKKLPIIVGESGVGKSALVEELAYRIQINEVPSYLKGKILYYLNPYDLVSGCEYTGTLENHVKELCDICKKNEIILFIDEIHTIYGIGATESNDNDLAQMLKLRIERGDIKIIGTTTDYEYEKYFSNDALKRRFEKIIIKEPNEEVLFKIIIKVMDDYSLNTGIKFENDNIKQKIAKIIIKSTKNNSRVTFDKVNNPDLSISIIDKAFGFALYYDSEYITMKHFSEAYEVNERIYKTSKEEAIKKLNISESNNEEVIKKVLKPNFNKNK